MLAAQDAVKRFLAQVGAVVTAIWPLNLKLKLDDEILRQLSGAVHQRCRFMTKLRSAVASWMVSALIPFVRIRQILFA